MSQLEESNLVQAITTARSGISGTRVAEIEALQASWEKAIPEVVEETECHLTAGGESISLFFVEAPSNSAHMTLVLSYALCLSSSPNISSVAVVGSSELNSQLYKNKLDCLLYRQYQIQLAYLADLAPESQVHKVKLLKCMPGAIPDLLLQGPIIRFQGPAPWNCARRYLQFLSSKVPVYSANFAKGVKKNPLDRFALVRTPAEITINHVYYQPPLILQPPVCSFGQRDSVQCVTALTGKRLYRVFSRFNTEIWETIGHELRSVPNLTWRLVGAESSSRVEELIPTELRRQITVEGVVTNQQLSGILNESKLLIYPGGVGGGGQVAMKALASGVVVAGVIEGNEVEAMFEGVNFVESQSDLWREIPKIITSSQRLSEMWIQQFLKIAPRLDLTIKADELMRTMKVVQ